MSDFTDVGNFHRKFDLHTSDDHPGEVPVPEKLIDMRIKFLQEEFHELIQGVQEWDHAQIFDALIDLVYVALGTAHLLGYPWQRGWDLVQGANMKKVRSTGDDDPLSKRKSEFDVVKPPGWIPPDIGGLLEQFGFPTTSSAQKCEGCGKVLGDGTTCFVVDKSLGGNGSPEVDVKGYFCERVGIVNTSTA